MNIANLYVKLKQILEDVNAALIDRDLGSASSLNEVLSKINGRVNRLPYVLNNTIIRVSENDFNGTTLIGKCAFSGCKNLKNVIIPDGITKIDLYAFENCTSLTDIYMYPTTPPTLYNSSVIPTATTIHVPIGSGNIYKSATNWSSFANKIIEDIVIASEAE